MDNCSEVGRSEAAARIRAAGWAAGWSAAARIRAVGWSAAARKWVAGNAMCAPGNGMCALPNGMCATGNGMCALPNGMYAGKNWHVVTLLVLLSGGGSAVRRMHSGMRLAYCRLRQVRRDANDRFRQVQEIRIVRREKARWFLHVNLIASYERQDRLGCQRHLGNPPRGRRMPRQMQFT